MVKKMTFVGICTAVALVMGANADTHVIGSIVVPNGTNGVNGTNGNDGLSAYQIWLNNGGSGTETEFLASLVGATGAAGNDGCATTLSKNKVGKVTTITAKNCNNETLWTETVEDGADGQAGTNGTNGKDFDPCESDPNSTTIVKKTTSTAYDRGTKTDGIYSKIGGQTITKQMCSGTQTFYEQDTCVEVAKPTGKCTGANKAYLQCSNAALTTDSVYYVCQDLGSNNSLAGKIEGKEDNVCAGNENSTTIVKKETTTSPYSKGNVVSGKSYYSQIGSRTVTRETCNSSGNSTFVVKDNCVEIVKPNGECTADTSAYLRCIDQTSNDPYFVCQSLGSGNNSLAGKIEGKADASDLSALSTTVSGKADASALSGYVKTDGSNLPATVVQTTNGKINAGVLPTTVVQTTDGKISAGVLPTTVVQTTNGKISAGVLPTTVVQTTDGKINSDVLPSNVTTDDNLKAQLLDSNLFGTCVVDTSQDTTSTTCTSGSVMEAIYTQLEATIRAAH
ncbi:MAG: hypothetical protein J6S80_03065 [Alphaproteobacteria bacterium]|nr:hypothetical protein [Alphaproteobacteria bacterium]